MQNLTGNENAVMAKQRYGNGHVFIIYWVIALVLYLPAAKAGWVIDAAGWLFHVRHNTFIDYINCTFSHVHSLYQSTQFITWLFYQLFGANAWAWSLLYISLHSTNAYLLYYTCKTIFRDSGILTPSRVAYIGGLIFLISPYASEVVIWKACYHYLQGMLFILSILFWVLQYQHSQNNKYALYSGLVFLISVFSLEIFYITPFLALSLTMYYRLGLSYSKQIFRQTLTRFIVPQLVMFCAYIIIFIFYYGGFQPHIPSPINQSPIIYLSKPIKYLFHILLLGRFFPISVKEWVYHFAEKWWVLVVFYGFFVLLVTYFFQGFRKPGTPNKVYILLLLWVFISLALLLPLPFPHPSLLVFYDRYCYFVSAFIYMLLCLLASQIKNGKIKLAIMLIFITTNLFFTIRLNIYWKHSAYITERLLHGLPAGIGNKTIILLNLPENMHGAPMIGADSSGEFKGLYQLFVDTNLKNTIYDAMAFNMLKKDDGAHVIVLNDSTVRVTLNQWGTWWWYQGHGGISYEYNDYRVNMKDVGHEYELILKHPYEYYLLLYETGCTWKTVNMANKNVEQD